LSPVTSSIRAVAKAAAADASFFFAGALFLKPCSLPTFLSFVGQHFPNQLEAYKRRYSNSAFVSPEYRKRIEELVNLIRVENKLGRRRAEKQPSPNSIGNSQSIELQPWLPF
jgi:hypothetical protein